MTKAIHHTSWQCLICCKMHSQIPQQQQLLQGSIWRSCNNSCPAERYRPLIGAHLIWLNAILALNGPPHSHVHSDSSEHSQETEGEACATPIASAWRLAWFQLSSNFSKSAAGAVQRRPPCGHKDAGVSAAVAVRGCPHEQACRRPG